MRIAVAQLSPTELISDNLDALSHWCIQARDQGADLLLTPEMALSDYEAPLSELSDTAWTLPQAEKLLQVQALAQRHQLALVVGVAEANADGTFYNTALLISAQGQLLQSYRKTHLFGDLDRQRFQAGSQLPEPVCYAGLKMSLAICYDVEFPELVRWHRQHHCDLLLVPTANMYPYLEVATQMVPTRAMESGVAIAYANFTGQGRTLHYCGHSCICSADGRRLAWAETDQALLIADIDAASIQTARQHNPYLQNLRDDLYSGGVLDV